jgi:hypothetical protein
MRRASSASFRIGKVCLALFNRGASELAGKYPGVNGSKVLKLTQ